ncbi:GNAT family N-acetyltransferase [Actinomadura rupiterrae]|uniref:GNAT family N-acetyltransferase n=1 Tax=Actinomadura rupiterrae TaxID=559627 RepID=UPI0020A5ABE6|nr:GNAT family N-acetyltransferase [Actinomadura rupiterrae]MCP2341551.1 putative GNAT superfamily acetyltransferase [Actinomadura rupiterrae]
MPVEREVEPQVRELRELEEFADAVRLVDRIWGPNQDGPPVPAEMMRALSHAGNYVAGAYLDAALVGVSVAFFGAPAGTTLHSHLTGALPGGGIGMALKTHQRDWARDRGLTRITWTFDPLVRRNAYFNLVKLGARPVEYLPSFYGEMADTINRGDESDRVLAAWDLTGTASHTPPKQPEYALRSKDGHPEIAATDAATVLVELPADIETLRRSDPGAARAWRLAVREVLGGLLAGGARVTGFHERTSYIVEHATDPSTGSRG